MIRDGTAGIFLVLVKKTPAAPSQIILIGQWGLPSPRKSIPTGAIFLYMIFVIIAENEFTQNTKANF